MTDEELFEHRFALAMCEPNIDKLKHELTAEQWDKWEQFYEQDMWGDQREDMRALATVLHTNYAETEATMQYPYFDAEDRELERRDELELRKASLESDSAIAERLARGKELYLANKAKANG